MTVCRVCLAMNVKLYRISEPKLSAMYERVTGVELNAEDKLPKNICWECVARLTSANNFIVKALKTQWMLMNNIDGRFITIRDIESIDRAEHQLESTLGLKFYDVNDYNLHIVEEAVEIGSIDECDEETIENAVEIKSFEDMRDKELSELKAEDDDISDKGQSYITEVDISCENDPTKTDLSDLNEDVKDDSYKADLKYEDGNTDINKEEFRICEEEDMSNEETVLYNKSATLSRCKELIFKDVYLSNYNIQDYNDNTHLTGENECHSSIEDYNTNMETLFNGADTVEALKLGVIDLGNDRQTISTNTSMVHTNSNSMLNDGTSLDTLFICDTCNKSFPHKYTLIRHILKYQKIYNCTNCSYKAHRKTYLDIHISAEHTKSIDFNCSFCSFKTNNSSDLDKHNVEHARITFNCPHCSFKTFHKGYFNQHVKHNHIKNTCHHCSYCSYKTNRQGNLIVHVNAKHTKSVSYNCSYCSYKTYQKGCLKLHIKSKHSDNVSFNCSSCSYKATNKQSLDQHVNATHTKPNLKPNLNKHTIAKRTKCATFNCSFCSFETCGKKSLERHVNATHTKSTSYNCTHCNYKVYDKSSLTKHINAKHTKIDFNCSHCSYKSYYKSAVNRHIKAKHS